MPSSLIFSDILDQKEAFLRLTLVDKSAPSWDQNKSGNQFSILVLRQPSMEVVTAGHRFTWAVTVKAHWHLLPVSVKPEGVHRNTGAEMHVTPLGWLTIKHSSVVGERKLCPVPPKPPAKNSHMCMWASARQRKQFVQISVVGGKPWPSDGWHYSLPQICMCARTHIYTVSLAKTASWLCSIQPICK